MHPSLRLFSAKAHQPLIRFVGKRSWPSAVEPSHPHPAAPPDYSKSFSELSENHQAPATNHVASESSNTAAQVYQEFWEAPSRFWQPRSRELEDAEIDAVL
ncbi:hypothetical protein SERLA73DRAFT_85167, partial [Serpula lacrymans var. lacrymans S7.3]